MKPLSLSYPHFMVSLRLSELARNTQPGSGRTKFKAKLLKPKLRPIFTMQTISTLCPSAYLLDLQFGDVKPSIKI